MGTEAHLEIISTNKTIRVNIFSYSPNMEAEFTTEDLLAYVQSLVDQTAQTTTSMAGSCRDKILTIFGPDAAGVDFKRNIPVDISVMPRLVGNGVGCPQPLNELGPKTFLSSKSKSLVINPHKTDSFVLDCLSDCTIIFLQKINHLVIRKCHRVQIRLEQGTVSGVEVLYGSGVTIASAQHNFVDLTYVRGAAINGRIENFTRVRVISCCDVTLNHRDFFVGVFTCCLFTGDRQEQELNPDLVSQSRSLHNHLQIGGNFGEFLSSKA